jgi:hypothetical protein
MVVEKLTKSKTDKQASNSANSNSPIHQETAVTTRQASPARPRWSTNTSYPWYLYNHAIGALQIKNGACKHNRFISLLFGSLIEDLWGALHKCGRKVMRERISTFMYAKILPAVAHLGVIVQWAAYPLAYSCHQDILTTNRLSPNPFAGFAYPPPGGVRLLAVRSIFFLQLLVSLQAPLPRTSI